VKKLKPQPTQEQKFVTQYAQLIEELNAQRFEKTPEQLAVLERAKEQKAELVRTQLWTHWLKVQSWTVSQAVFLVFGRDPDKPFIGYER